MVNITTDIKRRQGVTLVRATVTNTKSTTQTVTVESQVDGETWLPKRNGTVVPQWTDETWSAVLQPGESRGLGFVTPGDPTDTPVDIVSVSRSEPADMGNEQIIASLEEWSPPTDPSMEQQ